MQLTELTIGGFKSFAKKSTFTFRDGLTAIIGPNGSGKSNVAEAIRWVLGEQSLKQLRGGESSDILFNGSRSQRRSPAAAVTLTLSNEDGRLDYDASEVAITRRLSRSGDALYELNNQPVRLIDIQTLLADAGLGLKSYTVISQGMVDQHITATPLERRQLFEDACGVTPLKLRLGQAKRKLTRARTHMTELTTTIAEHTPRLTVLSRQVAEAEKREALQSELGTLQTAFYYQSWVVSTQRLQQAQRELAAAEAALENARGQRDELEERLVAAAQDAGTDDTTATATALQQQLARAEETYAHEIDSYRSRQSKRDELLQSIQSLTTEYTRATAQLEKAQQAQSRPQLFKNLRDVLARCRALCENIKNSLPVTTETAADLTRDIQQLETLLADDATSAEAATELIEQLEGPLAAVTRITTLIEERTKQLKDMPELPAPDATTVERLRAEVAALAKNEQAQTVVDLKAQLTAAHEAAATAEQTYARASDESEAAQRSHQALADEVARERGTEFLTLLDRTSFVLPADPVSRSDLERLQGHLSSIADSDPLALQEYAELKERVVTLKRELKDAQKTAHNTEAIISSLTSDIAAIFGQRLQELEQAFAALFAQLFQGGSARFVTVEQPKPEDEEEQTTEESIPGVDIELDLPNKSIKRLQLLSGGEKALTSLALLLAIVHVQKTPFVVLDEVDAALDEANSARFVQLLKLAAEDTQAIIITHNRETMQQADTLYGITMHNDGVSRVYSVKQTDIEEVVGETAEIKT